MHILFIPSWFPSIYNPRAGIFFQDYIKLIEKRHDCGIIFPNLIDPRLAVSRYRDTSPNFKYSTRILTTESFIVPKMQYVNSVNFSKLARKLYTDYIDMYGKPDIIHALSTIWGGTAARELGKSNNIPYFITEHASFFARQMIQRSVQHRTKEALISASGVAAVSKFLLKGINDFAGTHWDTVIPNVISNEFTPRVDEYNKSSNLELIVVANLNGNKRIEIVIQALFLALQEQPGMRLCIIGDGKKRNELINLVATLKLEGNINFLGSLPRDEVAYHMRHSDIYVISSDVETFSVSTAEALASGIPVILTRCGGPEEIVDIQNSIVIDTNNPIQMKDAILDMKHNYTKYKKSAVISSRKIEDNYSGEIILESSDVFYRKGMNQFAESNK